MSPHEYSIKYTLKTLNCEQATAIVAIIIVKALYQRILLAVFSWL